MSFGYDSYRPDTEPPGEISRRPPIRHGRRDSMFWRREQPSERRGRRYSNEVNSTSNPNHSPVNPTVPTGPKRSSGMVRSRSTAALERLSTNLVRDDVNFGSRRSSISIQPSPMSASSNGFQLHMREVLQEIDPPTNMMRSPQATNAQQVIGTMDPRLKNHRSIAGRDLVTSPILESGEEVRSSEGYGSLIKTMMTTAAEYNAARKEAEMFLKKVEKLEQDLKSAQKMFPAGNSYIGRLQQEIGRIQKYQETQKLHLYKIERDMENAAQAITVHENKNVPPADILQKVRLDQDEREKESKKREEGLKMQVFQLAETIDSMKAEMKDELANWKNQMSQMKSESIGSIWTKLNTLQTMVEDSTLSKENLSLFLTEDRQRLAQHESDLKIIRNEDLHSLRSDLRDQRNDLGSLQLDIKAQRLGMDRFNDVFASQESLKSLDARMDLLSKSVPSFPDQTHQPPKDYVTLKLLNFYVTEFKKFESKMDHQFSSRDSVSQSLRKDIATQTQRTDNLQDVVDESEQRLKSLIDQQSTKLDTLESITNTLSTPKANELTSDQLITLSDQMSTINSRIDSLETAVQSSRQTDLDNDSDHKAHTQQISNMLGVIRGLDEKSKANSHSIASLNQRFDNITTDQLARQMAGVIEPMLVNIRPQVQELTAQLPQIKVLQETLQAARKSMGDDLHATNQMMQQLQNSVECVEKANSEANTRLSSLDEGSKRMSQQLLDLDRLEESIQNVKTDIFSVRAGAHEAINETAAEIRRTIETLGDSTNVKIAESHTDVLKTTLDAIEKSKEDQSASLATLLEEVKEARNSIDARLAVVEVSNRDRDTGLAISKSNPTQKRSRSTSGATQTPSPTSRDTKSPTSSSSDINSTTNKESNTRRPLGLKPLESNSKASKISPLAKHFLPPPDGDDGDKDNDDDDDDDDVDSMEHTIVVNLPTKSGAATRSNDRAEVISISESDSNTEDPLSSERPRVKLDGEHYIRLKQPTINTNNRTKPSVNGKPQSSTSASKVVESPATKKRKRDRSQTSSKADRHSTNSSHSTPTSSQTKKKKKA